MDEKPGLTMSEFGALPRDIRDSAETLSRVHGLGDRVYAIAARLKEERDRSAEYVAFSEDIRAMLGLGYGEGYLLSDMLRVLKGRNQQWLEYDKRETALRIHGCGHDHVTSGYDHIKCQSCGSIRTDWGEGWGVAGGGKWFRSVSEAKFYRDNGRLPDASRAEQGRAS